MAKKTIVFPLAAAPAELEPIVERRSRMIFRLGGHRVVLDFHSSVRVLKQEPATVVSIRDKPGAG